MSEGGLAWGRAVGGGSRLRGEEEKRGTRVGKDGAREASRRSQPWVTGLR